MLKRPVAMELMIMAMMPTPTSRKPFARFWTSPRSTFLPMREYNPRRSLSFHFTSTKEFALLGSYNRSKTTQRWAAFLQVSHCFRSHRILSPQSRANLEFSLDGMGLGKTIQALALILAQPPRDNSRKTTLIVAPLALLRQWTREISSKVKANHTLTTFVAHGPPSRYVHINELLKYDIVLCTYGKLAKEYKMAPEQKNTHSLLILHKHARFHRVILDEAHNIKNKSAKVSLAAAEIQATYRLCMTGTPFMNRANELYPLIRFLRILPYSKWEIFSEAIDRPIQRWGGDLGNIAIQKLQVVFRSITIRRTKDSVLDDQPILQLPPRRDFIAHAVFDEEQLAYYNALELKQRLKFNKYLKAGTVIQNYLYCLVLLLRLRQVCDHPHLIKNHGIPDGTKLSADDMLALALKLDDEVVERLKAVKEFLCPLCPESEVLANAVIISPCGHYLCPECFNTSMAVRRTEGDGDELAKVICPAEGCNVEILPDNVFMHNFFVDAHVPGPEADRPTASHDRQFASGSFENFMRARVSAASIDSPDNEHQALGVVHEDSAELADNSLDLGGFVEAEKLQEDDYDMIGDGHSAPPEALRQQTSDDKESDLECRPSKSKSPPWRGSYDGLFVRQDTGHRSIQSWQESAAEEAVEFHSEQHVDGIDAVNTHGDDARDQTERLSSVSHQLNWQAGQNLQPIATQPAIDQQSDLPHPVIKRSSSVVDAHISTVLGGEGTMDNPYTIDDDDDEPLIPDASHESWPRAQSAESRQSVDSLEIVSFDGPSSPRDCELWRKRLAGSVQSPSSIKRARTYDFADRIASSQHSPSNGVPRSHTKFEPFGQADHQPSPARSAENASYRVDQQLPDHPEDDYDKYDEDEDEEDDEMEQPYQYNRLDPNTPVPSIEQDMLATSSRRRPKKTGNEFVSLGALRSHATKSAAAMHRYRQRLRKEWVPSAKTDKIIELLSDIRSRDRREKTLVFSQWTGFLDMLEVAIESDRNDGGFVYTRYDGGLRPDHRDAAVRNFMENPRCQVMLVSLTAGNAGLNLTAATNVIICEPFWNPFVEDQAVDRAHRIGQTRAVTVYRVLVADTVEDRILDLQKRKRALVDAVLGEGGASGGSQLTVDQLRGLFGV